MCIHLMGVLCILKECIIVRSPEVKKVSKIFLIFQLQLTYF